MEYGIRQLADLAGISTRTLRYYDEIGLLKPGRTNEAGYRYYGEEEVKLLQQILFFRERKLDLVTIKEIVKQPDFNVLKALEEHLSALTAEQKRILSLIHTVKLTIAEMRGEAEMSDVQKFEAFKKQMVEENEKEYGKEVRGRYGDEAAEEANERFLGLSEEGFNKMKTLEAEILRQLEEAVGAKENPEGESGHKIALLHREWLGFTWKKYSVNAHRGLVEMYLADERFKAYYDKNSSGCAEFLAKAVKYWIKE